jgi:aldose sugar dehydrogenase
MQRKRGCLLLVLFATLLVLNLLIMIQMAAAQPFVSDTTLNVEAAVRGLSFPTSMVFISHSDILVSEKDGQVRLVRGGILQPEPVLHAHVNTEGERGLLGITADHRIRPNGMDKDHENDIFLYYSEADPAQLRNRVYKYHWNGQMLVNPTLILDLPAWGSPYNVGGKIAIGPDGYLYAVIGDLNLPLSNTHISQGQLQNFQGGRPPDFTGSMFRVQTEDGLGARDNPFANSEYIVRSKYYAYGISNSFGMDFDPLTGNLWDTENGSPNYDEINLVRPGFNGGSQKVRGPISLDGDSESELVRFPGSHYADPLFSWEQSVELTDIEFLESLKLGERYANHIFVGDKNNGNLYFFEVNHSRDGINLTNFERKSGLSDLIVDDEQELSAITFGSGFGGIADIETGPDGLLYILSYDDGIIYEISNIRS